MKSGTGSRAESGALVGAEHRRRAHALGVVFGALAVVAVGFAPGASASDAKSKQWYLQPMQTEQMWKVSTGEGIKVAVIDTGVNANTPSLKGQVLVGEVPEKVSYRATSDYDGHGTTMAELIAGTGAGGGLQGLAPGVKIVPYRVELKGLSGVDEKRKTPEPWEAIRAAADTDAQIINLSFGGDSIDTKDEAAIKYAASRGKLLIAGVGNAGEGKGKISYPGGYPYVLGVASLNESNSVSDFSSYGAHVDLAAPGEGFPAWCDATFRSYCDAGGTSEATAITTASAALIWSAHPDWTANQVVRSLIDTASRTWGKDNPSKYLGYGAIRPRLVLNDPHYDAGAPYVDPLAKENRRSGEELVTEASPPASPDADPSASDSASPQAANGNAGGAPSAAAAQAESASGGTSLWIAVGGAAMVIAVAVAGTAVLRARRRKLTL
ncbi:S8 family serine peptidase [Streptomyces sp. bgisy154]|uniref:S8 family serine peptidase n=1 Tax=Streptomyces sp. bgisy154 TaxID=3413794 RepID=UPI003D726AE1